MKPVTMSFSVDPWTDDSEIIRLYIGPEEGTQYGLTHVFPDTPEEGEKIKQLVEEIVRAVNAHSHQELLKIWRRRQHLPCEEAAP
jgi:hypothetical protein